MDRPELEGWEPDYLGDECSRSNQAIIAALVPLLRRYSEGAAYPEAFDAEVIDATGFKGGDGSHGGVLQIGFDAGESGANDVICAGDNRVVLTARGDMEQKGLVCALAGLLADLLPVYDRK